MVRILSFTCSWMGSGLGWWLGSLLSPWIGAVFALLGFALGTYAGLEIVRRFRP